MSKVDKTIEGRLEEVLVSKEEQPYQVPVNWVWVKMGELIKINPPKSKLDLPSEQLCSFLPMSNVNPVTGRIYSFEDRLFDKVRKGYTYFEENDVLFAKITPCMENGNTVIAKGLRNHFGYGSTEFYVFRTLDQVNNKYLYYLLRSKMFRNQAKRAMTGAVGQQRVPKKYLENYQLALPPLPEQIRITEKIERLFGKIEEAKQLIEEAKETFELRKSSIIKKILNEGVNEVNPPRGWNKVKVKDLFSIFGGGTPSKSKPQYWNGEIPWISAKDMKTPHISNTMDYITEEGLNNSSAKLAKKGSVVMVVRSGILQRTLPVAYLLTDCTVNQDLKVFDSGNDLINKYFIWYIRGNEKTILFNYSKSGTTVNSIEFEKFKHHEIIIPPIDVLEKKIKKIEYTIEREESVNQVLNLNNLIENLTSAILLKAYRGELGTNDPSELTTIE
ncbi:restriction endonuclease subunit S [Rossellomorea oryzaecorticis]|uniref:Restriction endonuclease subunit S n=1 Tax=Rossellomorea oryzaecorticis TaxID=1396505 RepID=A0ABU9K7Q0_9BACI